MFLVLLILVVGAGLALGVKGYEAAGAKDAININTASSAKLVEALGVSADTAKKIVEARTARGGFADVDSLYGLNLEPTKATKKGKTSASVGIQAPSSSLIVRTWAESRSQFILCCSLIAVFLALAHLLLRGYRPRSDPFLLPTAALLAVLGLLLIFAIKDPLRDRPSFLGQAIGILTGGGLALFIPLSGLWNRLPLHRYGYVYAVVAVTLTAVLGMLGSGPGGVRLSVAGMQPVEAIKVLMVLFLAAYLAERGALLNDPLRRLGPLPIPRREDALPLLVLYALPLVLFAIVRDLGPALLLFGIFLTLVYLATGRSVYVALGVLVLLIGGYIGYQMRFGVFETRVNMWLSPWKNSHSSGDHLVLGWWGLASGGLGGSGLGLGGSDFIPRAGSDLAFAALGEETGIFGTLVVLVCFLILFVRGLRIAQQATKDFDRYVAAGLSTLLALQAILLIAGTLGILPLTGITLPLLSYGKSSLIASFVIVGILLALSERVPSIPIEPPAPFRHATARLQVCFFVLLGLIFPLRLFYLQGLASWAVAGRVVVTPDADRVSRPHRNPRLLRLASRIPRGKLLDRRGRILAVTKGDRRVYPYGAALGHLIGYADPTIGGPVGLESEFSTKLRGFEHWSDLVPLWQLKDIPGVRLPQAQDVILTIDAELQKETLEVLRRTAAGIRDRRTGRAKNRGAVVALDVRTGGILAAVTLPTFDPNTLTPEGMQVLNTDVDGDFPLINRALYGYYPPGSTFKIVTASALLANSSADFTANCGHTARNLVWKADGTTYARRRVVDDEGERAHGNVGLTEAVSESCNIYFARAGIELGPKTLRETADKFGFSKLPSTVLFGQELPDIAYGQGPMLTTPLEMATVAMTVAANGERLETHYLKESPRTVVSQPLSSDDAQRLAEMMRRVTINGTAAGRFSGVGFSSVAGKTGTAQNDRYDKMSHSWFIGFAPVNNPEIAFAVIVENGGYGASAAVPIARELLESYSRK